MTDPVLTIGHSTHPIEKFLALLQQNGITALVDVRSMPRSRRNPQFNRDALSLSLKQQGIAYLHLGKELGGHPQDPALYEEGKVQYARIADSGLFKKGIERVVSGSRSFRIALMCAEKEPLNCHRTLLVSHQLAARGVPILHIHADGHTEIHDDAMTRLLDMRGLARGDMFRSRQQLIDEACMGQAQNIAYVDENLAGSKPHS